MPEQSFEFLTRAELKNTKPAFRALIQKIRAYYPRSDDARFKRQFLLVLNQSFKLYQQQLRPLGVSNAQDPAQFTRQIIGRLTDHFDLETLPHWSKEDAQKLKDLLGGAGHIIHVKQNIYRNLNDSEYHVFVLHSALYFAGFIKDNFLDQFCESQKAGGQTIHYPKQ
ncbi:hypothetical protein COT72_03410 [archaeon CG10_big_fil_rev_8_21_14_0_10_43_11]|nr:MAG: hypothetical protein COT72_03410 [archaeon CG10_big_fil_rev_8_21_14_0_10_43_11]